VWLDLYDPDEADLSIVTEEFGLHPHAVEDAIHDRQRPKLDRYASHSFANMYAGAVDDDTAELTTTEISVFITARALITVRKADFDVDTLIERWDLNRELAATSGIGFLLYGLLDAIVDGHYAAVETLDDAVTGLEYVLFQPQATVDIRRRGFELRKSLADLRRVVAPMHELVGRLLHRDAHIVAEEMMPYYHDVYDHVLRTTSDLEAARDALASVMDTNMTEQSNELNETTKKLAAWAAIIAVPTAVTGYYGQNVPYPGFGRHSGFIVSTIVIVALAGGLYWLLRRRRWL
jgi:magnesium transporter